MKVYIAGPMRGHPDLNRKEFNDAEKFLERKTIYYEIINPVRLDKESGLSDEELLTRKGLRQVMMRDLLELSYCDVVYFLAGWEKSEGAKIEHALASMLNLTILYQ